MEDTSPCFHVKKDDLSDKYIEDCIFRHQAAEIGGLDGKESTDFDLKE